MSKDNGIVGHDDETQGDCAEQILDAGLPAISWKADQQITPMTMMQQALTQGAGLEQMTQLMDLQERWEANEAKKAYNKAMSEFKANAPEVYKNKKVSFKTSTGVTSYDHASLDNLASAVSMAMAPYGLSFRWNTTQLDGGVIRVTCIIMHEMGHSESVPLQASPDSSGGKNNIQAIGSTVKYLERYTLEAAAGIATKDKLDDDGRTGGEKTKKITDEHLMDLEAKITEVGADKSKFLQAFKIESLGDLPEVDFKVAISKLEQKAKMAAKK